MSIISDRVFDTVKKTSYWRVESSNRSHSGSDTHYHIGPDHGTEQEARQEAQQLVGTCRDIFIVDPQGSRTRYVPH